PAAQAGPLAHEGPGHRSTGGVPPVPVGPWPVRNVPAGTSRCLTRRHRPRSAASAEGSARPRSLSPAPLTSATSAFALTPLRRAEVVARAGSDPAERDHDQSDQDEQHRPAPRPLGLQDQEGATEEDPDRQCGGHQESQQTQDRSGQGLSSALSELPILSPVPAPPIPIEPVLRGAEARRPPAHLPGRHSPRPRAPAPCPP